MYWPFFRPFSLTENHTTRKETCSLDRYLLFRCRYIYLDFNPFLSLNPETESYFLHEKYFEHIKILIHVPFWKASYFWLYIKQNNDTSTLYLYLVSRKSLKFLLAARQVWCCLQLCLQRQQAKCKSHVFFPYLLKESTNICKE